MATSRRFDILLIAFFRHHNFETEELPYHVGRFFLSTVTEHENQRKSRMIYVCTVKKKSEEKKIGKRGKNLLVDLREDNIENLISADA